MTFSTGSRLGPYEILSLIGSGGMGDVYGAHDPRLDRDVAVKILPPAFAIDPDRLRRFEQEARATGRLNHPNVLAVYDVGTHEGSPYLVAELLAGETLRERLARGGHLALGRALDFAQQILRGLDAAHAQGILHRDLKPENLFLTKDGHLKILDFGLAKLQAAESWVEKATLTTSPPLTEAGKIVGTLGYMSPEQLRGQPVDGRSDLFSFGAIFYEMLTGERAFQRDTPADTVSAILSADPPEPALRERSVPFGVQRILGRCLEKEPEDRFHSARDVAFALEAISEPSVTAVTQATAASSRLTRRGLLAGLGGSLALGGLAAGYRWGRRVERRPPPTFRALTFRRGTVNGARFAPDGSTVVYSAAWDGGPSELFSTFVESPESRPLGLADAALLSISPRGELAVLLTKGIGYKPSAGTLARLPVAGGTPREIVRDVLDADWGPDGESLCVVRADGRLEYPIGRVLNGEADGAARVSPRGDRVAFVGADGGVRVVDRQGKGVVLKARAGQLSGLAWSPAGDEVWYSAGPSSIERALYAVSLGGEERLVLRAPESLTLLDVSRRGRVLLMVGYSRSGVLAFPPGEVQGRELGVFSRTELGAMSLDGRRLLLADLTRGFGSNSPVYLQSVDGSAPVQLGKGWPLALSPDGRWALCFLDTPPRLVRLPTGPGEPRPVYLGDLEPEGDYAAWALDGRRLFVEAREKGRASRVFMAEQESAWRPVTPEGVPAGLGGPFEAWVISPRGEWVAARSGKGNVTLYPMEKGKPRELPGERGVPIHWSADGRFLFLRDPGEVPAVIMRRDLETGERAVWRSLVPKDPTGVPVVDPVRFSGDASAYAYSYARALSDLYLAAGLQ